MNLLHIKRENSSRLLSIRRKLLFQGKQLLIFKDIFLGSGEFLPLCVYAGLHRASLWDWDLRVLQLAVSEWRHMPRTGSRLHLWVSSRLHWIQLPGTNQFIDCSGWCLYHILSNNWSFSSPVIHHLSLKKGMVFAGVISICWHVLIFR